MAKKKSLEELERTKELNAASQQAFLKAVTKNKSERMQGDGRYCLVKFFYYLQDIL